MASLRRSSSSSSSSVSGSEVASRHAREPSVTSQTVSQRRDRSPTNTIEGNSIAETNSLRSASPTPSQTSATQTRNAPDTTSIATTISQQVPSQKTTTSLAGGIPIIRPPTIQQSSGTGIGVFGPQRPTGYPTQPPATRTTPVGPRTPINIDVASAQQQYQQRAGPAQLSSNSE